VGASIGDLSVIDFKNSFPGANSGDKAGYSVNTGDALHPVLLDFDSFLVNIQIAGALTIKSGSTDIVQMLGTFFLAIDNTSFKVFATADLRVGPDINSTGKPLLGIGALGVFIINSAGFAADLDVNLQLGVPGLSLAV